MPLSRPNQQKRRKRKWRDKVKVVPIEQPEVVNEETLTRCQRCPEHRNRPGKFRVLINDGCFLCDACYRHEFPATAMLDEESQIKRNVKDIQHNITNAILDHVAELKQPGALVANDEGELNDESSTSSFPSEIECRMCLEKGYYRECCKSYYCHQCYFRSGRCPKCSKDAPLTGLSAAMSREDPGRVAVGLSWLISLLIVVIAITAIALLSWNASTFPVTISTNQCRGWLPTCDLAVCVEHNEHEESDVFLPATQPYKDCNRSTSAHQVIASACVYDWEAYVWSNHSIGYDLCTSSPREEHSRSTSISSPNPLLLYRYRKEGVYVFDDDFEFPLKEASAPWQEIVNGKYSNACGINRNPSERGKHGAFQPLENKNALVFGGKQRRHATTQGLNVEFGGNVEFHLKLGPLIQNDLYSECQAAFEGDIILEYNADGNDIWKTIDTYPAWKYRGEAFHFISEVIPSSARSNSTQFRLRQPKFDEMRDHWAIDDFRVLSKMSPEWQDSEEYAMLAREQSEYVKLAQCCLDTNQCTFFDKKRIAFDTTQCDNILATQKYEGRRLKVPELLLLFAIFAAATKLLYRLISSRFTRIVSANKEHFSKEDIAEEGTALFPRKKFSVMSSLSWQCSVSFLLCSMMLLTTFRLLHSSMLFHCMRLSNRGDPSCRANDGAFYIFSFVAFCFDVHVVRILLKRVFFVDNPRKRKTLEVEVDLHPNKRHLCIGTGNKVPLPLSEVTKLQAKGRLFSCFICFCYILGGLPLALGSLTIQSFQLGPGFDVVSPILGSLAVLREVFGPSLFAKCFLSIGWVFAFRIDDRKEFGRALGRKGLLQQFLVGTCLTPIVVMFTLLIRRVEYVSSTDNFMLSVIFTVAGGCFGLLTGVFRGVPTAPDAIFTSWPGNCYAIRYYDKVKCPCIFSWNYCGEIHSRQVLLIISLDDMRAFKEVLTRDLSDKNEY